MFKAVCLAACVLAAQPAASPAQGPTAQKAAAHLDDLAKNAAAFLLAKQDKTSGGWGVTPGRPAFPAITALALQGLLAQPGADPKDPAIAHAIDFLLSNQQKDGGIYDRLLPSYNTAISLTALSAVPNPDARLKDAIARAQAYLKTLQFGEGAVAYEAGETARVVTREDSFYGGWGYGSHGRPDLSNTAFAVEALKTSGLPENDAAFQRALVFLQRCQMLDTAGDKPVNDLSYARHSTQGGFIYSTSENKDRVGVGQSPAGEIVESLSGPAGLAATITLKKGPDSKPMTLTRTVISDRIKERVKLSSRTDTGDFGDRFIVVLGAGSAGDAGSVFEVRAETSNAEQFTRLLGSAFHDVTEAGGVAVRPVSAWQGESRLRCYGSMSYSGFKSYLYAGLTPADPRVQSALSWIQSNYTLDENPGVGTDGLYYYFLVFARAMHASGLQTVQTPSPRDWRHDLVERLAGLQQPDGSFKSVDDRWMESDPVLITAYSLVALQQAR